MEGKGNFWACLKQCDSILHAVVLTPGWLQLSVLPLALALH